MPVPAYIRAIFDHFHNLNLLVLLGDLRAGRAPRQTWLSGSWLCPVAHGLPAGQEVRDLRALGQVAEHDQDCVFAARQLGADPVVVRRFVRAWDEGTISDDCLALQLEELWAERLADAELMQELLQDPPPRRQRPRAGAEPRFTARESCLYSPSAA